MYRNLPRNLAFGLTGLLTIALIAATAVERVAGSESASTLIYHSPWMIALWAVATACCVFYLFLRRRSLSIAAIMLHAALLLIIIGAGITHLVGQEGKITLEAGATPADSFTLVEGGTAPLPFTITLDRAEIEYYPGTSTPMDYASHLTLDINGKTENRRVSMNRILDIDGYRFYQTGLGENSSTLSVSHDPWGIAVTYGGYLLLLLSMAAFPFSRRSRLRSLTRNAAAAGLLLLTSIPSHAATNTGATSAPPTIPRSLASRLGKVNVYWGDRVMPLQTMARDFCLKVNGSTSYRGLTPEQVVAGWLFYYDGWKKEPFIKIGSKETGRLIGRDGQTHACLRDFYTPSGYKLAPLLSTDEAGRDLRDLDQRVALVTMACTGRAFKLFPLPSSDTPLSPSLTPRPSSDRPSSTDSHPVEWLSLGDRPPVTLPEEDYIFISTILDRLSREIATRQWKNADDEISRLREYQAKTAPAGALLSESRLAAELFYNRFGSPLWPGILALAAGLLGLLPLRQSRHLMSATAILTFLWLTAILGLRWYVGGHLPLSNGYETMLLLGWLSTGASIPFLCKRSTRIAAQAALTAAGLSLMVAMMGRAGATLSPLMPVLSSPLLSIHVLLVMGSYALTAIIAILAAISLATRSLAKKEETSRLCALLLYPAVFLLAAGIFVGAVWANQSWGRYWGWDPKETWALVTLLIYSLPLHAASFPLFRRPRPLCLYLLLAFLSVLMTYFGVNHLLTGLHSYA